MGFRRAIGLAVVIASLASVGSAATPALAGSLVVWTTAPADGAKLSGVVAWRVGYSVLPQAVVFRVDGANVARDTAAPFRIALDTGRYAPGLHTLTAVGLRGTQRSRTSVTVRFLDSVAPSAPSGLVADATDSSLTLAWQASTDNVGVAGYRLELDGLSAGSTSALDHGFLHLACNTRHTLGVSAVDAAGNASAVASVTATTAACPATGSPPPLRFMYSSSMDGVGGALVASYGYNLMDTGSRWAADNAPAGTRGLVWLGDYNNTTCGWEQSDAEVRSVVTASIGDPKVAGFFISDEPDPFRCPNAPAQHRARTALIHQLDPSTFVVMVVDSNSGQQTLSQIPLWSGAADYIGLDPYPCYTGEPCDFAWVDNVIRAADAAGLSYWGVVQAFRDTSGWRWPTADELAHMLGQWSASRESGMMTFAWSWDGYSLATRPDLTGVLAAFNSG
jgi:Big-like domain-containing protein